MNNDKFTKLREGFTPIILLAGKGKELFYNGELVQYENGIVIPEGDSFVNSISGAKNSVSRMLSNLFPYDFFFRGQNAKSIEGVLQGIKHKEPLIQKQIMQYHGLDALYCREANKLDDWRIEQILFWDDEKMARDDITYQNFLDELYLALQKNPLYAKALKCTGKKTVLHSIGKKNPAETVLTRNEFESRLNSLKEL